MIEYWRRNLPEKNMGDFLTELLLDLFDTESRRDMEESRTHCFHLIGSVISDDWIGRASRKGAIAVFWGCGYRGERLRFDERHYRIYGVRGKLTETFFGRRSPAIGDPGLACPLLLPQPEQVGSGEILLMPHIGDPSFADNTCRAPKVAAALERDGVTVLSPIVRNRSELDDIIRRLAGAKFVLAGAMHAAVIALAYGVPFAFYRTSVEGYVNYPLKWQDLASLHGFEPHFVSSYEAGRSWYRNIAASLIHPPLQRLLEAAPGRVKAEYLAMARRIDADRAASGNLAMQEELLDGRSSPRTLGGGTGGSGEKCRLLPSRNHIQNPSAAMNPHSSRPEVVDLIGPRFDRVNSEPAERTLIICAAPRTGSNELSRMLTAAGIGVALEYFHPNSAAILAARWGLPTNVLSPNELGSYISQLRKRRSAGGVFATKLQHWQYAASLRNSHGRTLFDGAVVVHLFRADATRQFVSWHRAQESGRYDFSDRTADPPGSPERLLEKRRLVGMANFLVAEDAGFRRLFIMSGIHPIFVEFNELTRDFRPIIEEIGRALEVPLDREGLNAALAATAPYDHGPDSAQDRERRISNVLQGSAFETGPNDTFDNQRLAPAARKPTAPGSVAMEQAADDRTAMQLPPGPAMTIPYPPQAVEKRNLVLVTHPRKQDWRDFEAIGREVARLAPDIFVYIVSPLDTPDSIDDWNRRSLTVSFGALGGFEPRRGRIFQSAFIPKHEEYRFFTAGGVPMPFTSVFRSDQPFEFSRHKPLVVAKPTKMGTMSHGDKVFLMRRERVQQVVPARFSPELMADHAPVIVQDFIHPGPRAQVFRVLLLFGEPLFCYRVTAGETPPFDAADSELESTRIASNVPERTIEVVADGEVIAFAKGASQALWWIPLQGMDIIRETGTGTLYVLESNPGGNTWVFSSQVGAETRALTGGADPLRRQFGAWGIAAKALIKATRSYAE